jgi:Fe-S oxidoreductase
LNSEAAHQYTKNCIHGALPACSAACPFHLDTRTFTERAARGRWNAAYKIYRDAVAFPAIVSFLCTARCKADCVRTQTEDPVDLLRLEQAAVRLAKRTDPVDYNLPVKAETVSILGAGPAGLACALMLARKKYPVTVYEKADRIGGILRDLLPRDLLQAELAKQFLHTGIVWVPWPDVPEVPSFPADATFVSEDAAALGDAVAQIAEGIRAANRIERFLRKGAADAPDAVDRCGRFSMKGFAAAPAVVPADPAVGYTEAEALREAARCLRCDCSSCRDACDMLRYFDRLPPQLPAELYATLYPVPQITKRPGTRLLASCSLCGLCREVCPEGVDSGALLADGRAEMVARGSFPPVFHDFWLRDLSSVREKVYLRAPQKGSEYLFYPGCQLAASDPQVLLHFFDLLTQRFAGMGILHACCGAPAFWAGERGLFDEMQKELTETLAGAGSPILVTACPMCEKIFRTFLPDLRVLSVYELLAKEGLLAESPQGGPEVALYDPCAARDQPAVRDSVRRLLSGLGYRVQELFGQGEEAPCCSFGGHIYPANPALADSMTQARTGMSDLPYVAYCANCKDIFRAGGKETAHLIDLIVAAADRPSAFTKMVPSLGDRIRNRAYFLERMKTGGGEPMAVPEAAAAKLPQVHIGEELIAKMDRLLITDRDVQDAIATCEETGAKIILPDGRFSGHKKIGEVTLWVEYLPEDGKPFVLADVYVHRMAIAGAAV